MKSRDVNGMRERERERERENEYTDYKIYILV